ncbi:MAG TPA: hypothetical protein ENJ30_06105 [Desulfobulbaceae bacterium]|nr:hypothetical protein [Desulfobulbaceae bacterium]
MARREASDRNEVEIHDNLSNTDILFYYRTPTTSELEGFNNLAIVRKGKKVKFQQPKARLKYGLHILTGIREGDFERSNGKGGYVAISSDKQSPNYYPEWKAWLRKNAADLVMLLGMHVFDVSGEIEEPEELLDLAPEEDIAPNLSETLPR